MTKIGCVLSATGGTIRSPPLSNEALKLLSENSQSLDFLCPRVGARQRCHCPIYGNAVLPFIGPAIMSNG